MSGGLTMDEAFSSTRSHRHGIQGGVQSSTMVEWCPLQPWGDGVRDVYQLKARDAGQTLVSMFMVLPRSRAVCSRWWPAHSPVYAVESKASMMIIRRVHAPGSIQNGATSPSWPSQWALVFQGLLPLPTTGGPMFR